MIRRPPRSTLFPSRRSSDLSFVFTIYFKLRYAPCIFFVFTKCYFVFIIRQVFTHSCHPYTPVTRDRKSTRLNSSHANISYAVFCLKKKNHSFHTFILLHQLC